MDKLLEHDLTVKIVSVLLAVLLWLQFAGGSGAGSAASGTAEVKRVVTGVPVL